MSPLLTVQQLDWQLRDRPILSDLSFSVQPGEIVGLIGPNGAGKSSLLKVLQGRIKPTRGDIQLQQRPLASYSARQLAQQLAVVEQQPTLLYRYTVMDIVKLGLIPHKHWYQLDNQHDAERIWQTLDRVGLTDLAHSPFEDLSGGEQQRVLIARALVQQPTLLLLDEPTNHLDVHYQHQLLALLRQLGLTVLIAIHDLDLAAGYCDRILLLANGQLRAQGQPAEVLTAPLLSEVFQITTLVDRHPLTPHLRVNFAAGLALADDSQQIEKSR